MSSHCSVCDWMGVCEGGGGGDVDRIGEEGRCTACTLGPVSGERLSLHTCSNLVL